MGGGSRSAPNQRARASNGRLGKRMNLQLLFWLPASRWLSLAFLLNLAANGKGGKGARLAKRAARPRRVDSASNPLRLHSRMPAGSLTGHVAGSPARRISAPEVPNFQSALQKNGGKWLPRSVKIARNQMLKCRAHMRRTKHERDPDLTRTITGTYHLLH